MKSLFTKLILGISLAFGMSACQNDLDNDLSLGPDNSTDSTHPGHAEGYFTATFFPQQAGTIMSRADGYDIMEPSNEEVNGKSKAIQDLICLIYKKEEDVEDYILFAEQTVIHYDAQGTKIQQYEWPLKNEVSFVLPNGDYKAVFVGNATKNLFTKTVTNEILTGVDKGSIGTESPSKFYDASLNMPVGEEGNPIMFEDVDGEVTELDGTTKYRDVHNMLYLCTVDFNEHNFDGTNDPPYVLMQRVVSQNYYGRDFVNENDMLDILINNIVNNIENGTLITENIKGLLRNKLFELISQIVNEVINGLYTDLGDARITIAGVIDVKVGEVVLPILQPLLSDLLTERGLIGQLVTGLTDELVDPLLQALLSDILQMLNKQLLNPVLTRVGNTLNGTDNSLLGLGALLNPWTHVNAVDIEYQSLTKSIGFDREVKSYFTSDSKEVPAVLFFQVPIIKKNIDFDQTVNNENDVYYASVTTLSGKVSDENNQIKQHLLSKIDVNKESADKHLLGLIGLLLDDLDHTLLGGLLVNIHKDLTYPMESNLQYSTRCNLLNLTLNNFNQNPDDTPIQISLPLGTVLPTELVSGLVSGLLGEGSPLTTLLRALTEAIGGIVDTVTTALKIATLGLVDLTSTLKPLTGLVDNILTALVGDSDGSGGLVTRLVDNLTLELNIQLPSLGINNIRVEGSWNDTSISNGGIIQAPVHENI